MKRPAKCQAPGGEGVPLSTWGPILDRRPILVAVAGPSGAEKTTLYQAHLRLAGLRFANADEVARATQALLFASGSAAGYSAIPATGFASAWAPRAGEPLD